MITPEEARKLYGSFDLEEVLEFLSNKIRERAKEACSITIYIEELKENFKGFNTNILIVTLEDYGYKVEKCKQYDKDALIIRW